ncbi:hypothetical protein [Paenibacillus sp. OK003]|uniref:hypothetical protein n=1 Tax=Paenibacillus sp. OK003 TaxID=1884380 RepID=UPI0008B496B3|nr:hypothetical protein [Paenibacillus sp. OK003]SEL85393.1 hypothetical protein SAMN05518856_12091 [Paenibacillus sp. OK003]
MSSKLKMSWAMHPTAGRVSVDDIQLDEKLNNSLKCEFCNVDVSFVGTYIKNEKYMAPILRLNRGKKNHLDYEGGECPYNKTNNKTQNLPTSKVAGVVIDKELVIRVNIPVDLKKSLMDLLSQDLIPIKEKGEKNKEPKKSPGNYTNTTEKLSDYINSARAFAKIAQYFEKHGTQNFLEFKFFGVSAPWTDIYFENWDRVFEKFQSKTPKELVCLRGTFTNIGKEYPDENGYPWVQLKLKKTPLSKNEKSDTFAQIKLFKPMFERFISQLNEAKNKSEEIEITFFGRIERYTTEKGDKNIKGVAVLRKQIHFEKR